MSGYSKPEAGATALRLHLNENTDGCSPHALAAVRALSATDLARYPEYGGAIAAVAQTFALAPESILLTNGLDEGILAAAAAAFRLRDGCVPEAVGVTPAFDMYETVVDGLGGRMRLVALGPDFRFSASAIACAVSAATRIVFVANPHNPSGAVVSRRAILELAIRIAPVSLFVDEAYADFAGESILDERTLLAYPNVMVGRTFAKSHGLAGLRIGVLAAAPATLAPVRKVVPPYSVNAAAAAALPAALEDGAHRERYLRESEASRQLLSEACARWGWRTYPSSANFVLVDAGREAARLVAALAAHGIAIRDRSGEPGCSGCVRITAGTTDATRRVLAAMEDACRAWRV